MNMRETPITKKQFISTAYKIVQEEGVTALSIRRLGRALNCNTANLYRYFSSLEELTLYVALDNLQGYLNDISKLFQMENDCVSRYYGVWHCFCTHAFAHAHLFNLLFFSKHSSELYKIIPDYYAMFPNELEKIDSSLQFIFLQGDFDYRDFLMLDEIVKQGKMNEFDSVILNNVAVNLFKGYFKTVLDQNMDQDKSIVQMNRFLNTLQFVMEKYISP